MKPLSKSMSSWLNCSLLLMEVAACLLLPCLLLGRDCLGAVPSPVDLELLFAFCFRCLIALFFSFMAAQHSTTQQLKEMDLSLR